MIARSLLFALALLPVPASAAEKVVGVGSFEQVRVEGALDVRVVNGPSPRVTVSGDAQLIERVSVIANGTGLTVRLVQGGSDGRPAAGQSALVTLTTPRLTSVTTTAGGRVRVARMAAPRANISVSGAGSVAVDAVAAEDVVAMLIGTGAITLSGTATRARLMTSGPGSIDAAALRAGEVNVRLDGPGETRAQARYTALVTSTGLGMVEISGAPKCTVRAPPGAPVRCGIAAR